MHGLRSGTQGELIKASAGVQICSVFINNKFQDLQEARLGIKELKIEVALLSADGQENAPHEVQKVGRPKTKKYLLR